MELLDRVERTISEQDLLPDGATVLVAVSGGSDSLAMLDLLGRLAPRHGWRLHVATFDHRWGPHGIEAVELVRRAAAERGLPCLADAAAEPTAGEAAARCHLARTIVRRAEREAVALSRVEAVRGEAVRYLNRLSDLLFVLARVLARADGHGEVLWNHERRHG